MGEVMLSSAIGIVALMVTTWIVSLIKKNASIVDIGVLVLYWWHGFHVPLPTATTLANGS